MSNPSLAWQRLQAGNQRFFSPRSRDVAVAKDGSPVAVVFRCADAPIRSDVVFGQAGGSVMDLSNWGHVVDTGVLATVEYAVGTLQTPLIVILGHAHCAAMHRALQAWNSAVFPEGASRAVIEQAISSLARHDATITDADELSAAHVVHTAASLLDKSSLIATAVDQRKTAIICLTSKDNTGRLRPCATFGDVDELGDAPLLECV
ncbi:carbonic anhydrase [Mycobacterium sp. ML4]